MAKLTDLRFIIGLFFLLVGLILIIAANTTNTILPNSLSAAAVNFWSGLFMLGFGLAMAIMPFI